MHKANDKAKIFYREDVACSHENAAINKEREGKLFHMLNRENFLHSLRPSRLSVALFLAMAVPGCFVGLVDERQ